MTYQQVVEILGSNGEELSRTELIGIVTVMVMWRGPALGNMNVMFQDGRVISKAQFGLR